MNPRFHHTNQTRCMFGTIDTKQYSGQDVAALPDIVVVPSIIPIAFNRACITEVLLLSDLNAVAGDFILYIFDRDTGNLSGSGLERAGWQGFVRMPAPVTLPWEIGGNPVYGYHAHGLKIDVPIWRRPTDQTEFVMGLVLYNDNGAKADNVEAIIKYERAGI